MRLSCSAIILISKRAGFYSSTDILYERSSDLEKENVHVVIIDVKVDVLVRVINVY